MGETEKRKIKLSRRLRLVLTTVSVFALIIFSALIYFSLQLESLVAARLTETIKSSTNGLYHISFSNLRLNPFTGSVMFENLVFTPNEDRHREMIAKKQHPTHLYSIRIDRLTLKKLHPIKVYFNRDLRLHTLHIENPVIKVYYQRPRDDEDEPEDKRTAWKRISKYLKAIRMEEIILDNVDFQYIDKSSGMTEIDGVKNLSIHVRDLLIDSLSGEDKSRFYFTREIFVNVKDHDYLSRDKLYRIRFEDLSISSSKNYASVKNLNITPLYPEMEFYKHLSGRKARMEFHLSRGLMHNIDFKRLITKRQLRASSLNLYEASMNMMLDLRNKRPDYDRGHNFPQLALKRFSLNTLIDTLSIQNSNLHYAEYSPVTARKGFLFFNKLNGAIYNFTNDSLSLKQDKWVHANFSTLFYGKAKLDLDMRFNLLSKRDEYHYSGQLSSMNAKNFNNLSRGLALLKINSGKIENAKFKVTADYRNSRGTLTMRYNNLNIGLLRIDSNKMLRQQVLKSIVANTMLLRECNPSENGKLIIGNINYTRPDSIAFFGTIWQSIYTGLKETIGLTPEREQELVSQFKGINMKSEAERDRIRDIRKERRKNRREAKEAR